MSINFLFSQEGQNIKGKVVDENDSLVLGNVLLLSAIDSSLIKGEHFLDGAFEISVPTDKDVLLKVRAYGFVDLFISVNKSELITPLDLGTIKMELINSELGDVTVTARIPLFETSERGTLIVNVDRTMLSSSTSILDVLSKSPGVIVINGDVTVLGKGSPVFYVDNQKVPLETLKAIPVSQIKSIEVITNPSARYEADATAVIRIVTKNFNKEGFQVNLKQNVRKGFGLLSYSEAGINYRKGKLELIGNYNIELGTSRKIDDYERTADYGGEIFNAVAKTTTDIRHNNQSSYLIGANYDLTKKSVISLQWNGRYTDSDYDLNTENNLRIGSGFNSRLLSHSNISPTKLLLNRFSLNYLINLDSLGSNLSIGGQYSNQKDSYTNILRETFVDSVEVPIWQKKVDYLSAIDIYTGNIEYELKMKNKNTLRLGAKISSVRNETESAFEIRENENQNWISAQDFTSGLNYSEDYLAGYTEYEHKIKSVMFHLGLRAEYTKSNVLGSGNIALYDTTYLNIFPSASILKGKFSLNYAMKIKRIPFDYLNGVSVYIDSFSVSQGNPYLLPTYYNSIDINYANLVVLGYSRITNELQQFFIQDEVANRTIITFDNVSAIDRYSATLTLPIPSKKFVSYLVSGLNYSVSRDERFLSSNIKPKPQIYVYGFGSFNIKKWFTLQVIGQFVSGSSNGISSLKPFGNVDISVSKNLMKNKLAVELYAGDIFRTTIYNGTQYSETTNATFNVVSDTRFIRLTLKYNFGRLKVLSYKENDIGKEESDRTKSGVE
ncbi:MAG: hypothetical protein ACJASQ_003166 [Crocinitomicaceae bacterium]|jgi:hypothetical protein